MRHANWIANVVLVTGAVAGLSTGALAVPYASGVHNIGGDDWEFVLNQDADSVTITRDGGNEIVFDSATALRGRHQFSMTGFSDFEIAVARNDPVGWTAISDHLTNSFELFERPNGLVINNDPSHAMFGTVYVVNGTSLNAAVNGARTMGDGVYAMTADRIGVDLANNFAVVADPNDATQAKAPGWTVDDASVSTEDPNLSAWRVTLDEAGNLIVSDFSDSAGGLKYASADLTSGGSVFATQDGILPLLVNGSNQEVHGSIVSQAYVTGSVGNNLVVYAMDEDYDLDGDTTNPSSGHHIWRWNVGNSTAYDVPPELIINLSAVPDTSEGPNFLDLPGSIKLNADAEYSPQHDKWYITERRSDGSEAGLIIVSADGVDGNSPTLEWSSLQFSIDNDFDGFQLGGGFEVPGIQDIFRLTGDVEISPDGTKLYLHRNAVNGDQNPFLGLNSPNGAGEVLIIPLDENGIPVLEIDDNDTPEDPNDDVITNIESIDIAGAGAHSRAEVALDAAGNLYTTNNSTELLQTFSPGGNTIATTTSAGTFDLQILEPTGLPGDYNGDGWVNAADYTVWRDNLGEGDETALNGNGDGMNGVDSGDYTLWVNSFGTHSGSGSVGAGQSAVPEPTAWLLTIVGALGLSFSRGRSRRNAKV